MACCSTKCKKIAFLTVSTILVILGITLVALWRTIYNSLVHNELQLTNSSTSYKMWEDTPIPIYFEIYLFNWTNSEEVIKDWNKIKPKVEECGPYTFLEHHKRVDLKWHEKNNSVTYKQVRTWHFLPDKSKGNLNDVITTLNPIVATVANFLKDKNVLIQKVVDIFLEEKEKKLSVSKSVKEFLFDGYEDELLVMVKKLNITGLNIPFDKFGWFYNRNNSATYDGEFTMFTGSDDINKLGLITHWNGVNRTSYFHGHCADVKGTSGELWPPTRNARELFLFVPDTCSYLTVDYKNETELHGLDGSLYIGKEKVIDNGTLHPDYACFNGRKIEKTGVRDISKCKFGAPAFISYPHFYLADPWYANEIDGMFPDKDKHELTLALEPSTGVPLSVNAKIQINLMIEKMEHIKMFKNVKKTFIPMLWFKQTAELNEELAGQIKMLLVLPQVLEYTGYGLISLFVLFLVVILFTHFRKEWMKDSDRQQLINNSSTS